MWWTTSRSGQIHSSVSLSLSLSPLRPERLHWPRCSTDQRRSWMVVEEPLLLKGGGGSFCFCLYEYSLFTTTQSDRYSVTPQSLRAEVTVDGSVVISVLSDAV